MIPCVEVTMMENHQGQQQRKLMKTATGADFIVSYSTWDADKISFYVCICLCSSTVED